ncbi:MAG: polymer-forming cytoskeletal protein [Balneolaceae bacterium]|jgi:cytoskeletal protein CcmA (bactofilin family)
MKTNHTFFDKDTTVEGELETTDLILGGSFKGKIKAKKKILVKNSARINADIEAGKLLIEEGASLNGKITLTGASD